MKPSPKAFPSPRIDPGLSLTKVNGTPRTPLESGSTMKHDDAIPAQLELLNAIMRAARKRKLTPDEAKVCRAHLTASYRHKVKNHD